MFCAQTLIIEAKINFSILKSAINKECINASYDLRIIRDFWRFVFRKRFKCNFVVNKFKIN